MHRNCDWTPRCDWCGRPAIVRTFRTLYPDTEAEITSSYFECAECAAKDSQVLCNECERERLDQNIYRHPDLRLLGDTTCAWCGQRAAGWQLRRRRSGIRIRTHIAPECSCCMGKSDDQLFGDNWANKLIGHIRNWIHNFHNISRNNGNGKDDVLPF